MNFYDYSYLDFPIAENHRFPYDKYKKTQQTLSRAGADIVKAKMADRSELGLIHTEDYLNRIFTSGLSKEEERRIGLPWSKQLAIREAHMVGACLQASDEAMTKGKAAVIGGGTHHAFPFAGEGYCVFNDICTAHLRLKRQNKQNKSLIIDLDVHQGNGNAAIAAGMHELYTLDLYCESNFPFSKVKATLDYPIKTGSNGLVYLDILQRALEKAKTKFRPNIVFIILGADTHKDDKLGKLNLSDKDFAERDALLHSFLKDGAWPFVLTLGGGYAEKMEKIVELYSESLLRFNK